MTQEEIEKLRVINQTIDKVITIRTASELLDLSERQVIRLKGGVLNYGAAFIIHKNRGRKPDHAISDELKEQIISLKRLKYAKANFIHFQELLEKCEGIKVSYPSVYRILSQAGIKSPKKHRKVKSHHRRKRISQAGMLVQIDASPFVWFGEKVCTLHGAIDDATGEILGLFFTENECLQGYFQVMDQLLLQRGKPVKLYCDRHTIFFSPKCDNLSTEEQLQGRSFRLTQFGRAMDELGIKMIKARSPQAKGRIERLWNTLQGRLPTMFELEGITDIKQANAFMPSIIDYLNNKFAVEPEDSFCAFRKIEAGVDLSAILCIKEMRTLLDRGAFSYKGRYYQLNQGNQSVDAMPKAKVTVLDHEAMGVRCVYKDVVYDTVILNERPKKEAASKALKQKRREHVKPAANHPWRQVGNSPFFPYGAERDSEILTMLDELFSSTRAWV